MFHSSEAWRSKCKSRLSQSMQNEAFPEVFHHRSGHDGARTRFATGSALNEKSIVGGFWKREFPEKLELKSSWTGEGVSCNASPNKSTTLEERFNNDIEGDGSCVGGKGDDDGGVRMLEEEVELALEKRRLREELSDPNEGDLEGDDGEDGVTDASEITSVISWRDIGFP